MTIFEINDALMAALLDVDQDTGEWNGAEAYDSLQLAKDEKIENTAMFVKEMNAEAIALSYEIKALQDRKDAAERAKARATELLGVVLDGEKFKTARVSISYRKSVSTEVVYPELFASVMQSMGRDDLLTYKTPEPNKTAIKEALKAGQFVPGAQLVEKNNIVIK